MYQAIPVEDFAFLWTALAMHDLYVEASFALLIVEWCLCIQSKKQGTGNSEHHLYDARLACFRNFSSCPSGLQQDESNLVSLQHPICMLILTACAHCKDC